MPSESKVWPRPLHHWHVATARRIVERYESALLERAKRALDITQVQFTAGSATLNHPYGSGKGKRSAIPVQASESGFTEPGRAAP